MKDSSSSDLDSVDNISKPLPKSIPRVKRLPLKDSTKVNKTALNVSEQEINVKIPTSDTTDIVVKVKPLDNVDLKNKRIHVRINQKKTPDAKSKSRKIVYGRKSLIGHHLRKTKSPMFSHRMTSPRLDKHQLLKRVIDFTESAKRQEDIENQGVPKKISEKEAKLQCQKLIREKRTQAVKLRKLVNQK